MPSKLKIAFLTSIDPTNKRSLSGSPYYILQALKKYVGEVEVLGPVKLGNPWLGYVAKAGKMLPRPYNINHSYIYARLYARAFGKKLKDKKFDFIFAPRCSTEIALLKTDIPIIYYSDTTFNAMYNYYEWFSNFNRISEIEGDKVEAHALKNAAVTIFSSEWAQQSAINYYNTPPEKTHIVPFGPNVDYLPDERELNYNKENDVIKLLFIGVEWERKGGQIAFETLIELKKKGFKAKLVILGVEPPDDVKDDDLIVIPFLDKNIKEESDKFNSLLLDSHFLILPTREECFGVVFCEASAYGLPSLTTDTGGVGGAVVNGENGYRLNLNDKGDAYASKVAEIFSDYEKNYIPLAKSSRKLYEEVLNWKSFGTSIKDIFEEFVKRQ